MPQTDKILAICAALGSAASWALGAVLFKGVGDRMSPLGMTFAKGIASMVLLGTAMACTSHVAMDRQTFLLLALSGVIGIALGDTLFFKALGDLGPVSMIVLMMVGQVVTILLALAVLHEVPSPAEWIGMAFILAGVCLALSADLRDTEAKPSGRRGLLFGLGAVLCMAVSIIIAKKPLASVPSLQATFFRMGTGTLVLLGMGTASGSLGGWVGPLRDGRFLARFLLAVAVVTFGGFWLSMFAVKHLDVALANTLNSTEPIFVLPLAFFLLKERLKVTSILGAVSVVAGVALIFFFSGKP